MVATGGFEPPTNALLQHWSTHVTYLDYYINQVAKTVCDCTVIKKSSNDLLSLLLGVKYPKSNLNYGPILGGRPT